MTTILSDSGVQFADTSTQLSAANIPIPFTAVAASGVLTVTVTQSTAIAMQYVGGVYRANIAANSALVIPALASLGVPTGISTRLYLLYSYANLSLMVSNSAGGLNLDETNALAPTVISAAATSNSVVYSALGTASTAYKVIGFIDIVWTTGIGWSVPSNIGCISASMVGSTFGQTRQNLTASRALGTTYYNSTGKEIEITVILNMNSAGTPTTAITENGNVIVSLTSPTSTGQATVTAKILPGASYVVTTTAGPTLATWWEKR